MNLSEYIALGNAYDTLLNRHQVQGPWVTCIFVNSYETSLLVRLPLSLTLALAASLGDTAQGSGPKSWHKSLYLPFRIVGIFTKYF